MSLKGVSSIVLQSYDKPKQKTVYINGPVKHTNKQTTSNTFASLNENLKREISKYFSYYVYPMAKGIVYTTQLC